MANITKQTAAKNLGDHTINLGDILVGIQISQLPPECSDVTVEGRENISNLLIGIKVSKIPPECS